MLFDGLNRVIMFGIVAKLIGINLLMIFILIIVNVALTFILCRVIRKIPIVHVLFGL